MNRSIIKISLHDCCPSSIFTIQSCSEIPMNKPSSIFTIQSCSEIPVNSERVMSYWQNFSSLTAPEVVILTNSSAVSDKNFINMMTFPFPWTPTCLNIWNWSNSLLSCTKKNHSSEQVVFTGPNSICTCPSCNDYIHEVSKPASAIWIKQDAGDYSLKDILHCLNKPSRIPLSVSSAQIVKTHWISATDG